MAGAVGVFSSVESLVLPWSAPPDRLCAIASTISIRSSSSTRISVILLGDCDSSCDELFAHRFKDRGRVASGSKVDPSVLPDVPTEDRRANYGAGRYGSCSIDFEVRFVDLPPLEESSSGNGEARSFCVWVSPLWHYRPPPSLYPLFHQGIFTQSIDSQKLECDESVAQRAWNILNDSLQLPLCVQFTANTIACAALYLAAMLIIDRKVDR